MFRFLATVMMLTVVATLPAEAGRTGRTTGEEIPSVGRTTGEEIPSAFPWMIFSGSKGGPSGRDVRVRDTISLRRIHFYSAGGECYARDRSGHWHWVDWRLC
jgi:hypothetical protein